MQRVCLGKGCREMRRPWGQESIPLCGRLLLILLFLLITAVIEPDLTELVILFSFVFAAVQLNDQACSHPRSMDVVEIGAGVCA